MEPVDEPLAELVLLLEEERMLEELGLLGLDFLPIRPSCLSCWSKTSTAPTSEAVSIDFVASCLVMASFFSASHLDLKKSLNFFLHLESTFG